MLHLGHRSRRVFCRVVERRHKHPVHNNKSLVDILHINLDLQHHVVVTTTNGSALREQQHDSGWQLHNLIAAEHSR